MALPLIKAIVVSRDVGSFGFEDIPRQGRCRPRLFLSKPGNSWATLTALPPAPTSGGSTSVSSVTPAIQKAAESAKKKLLQLAIKDKKSPFFGMNIEDVAYKNGDIVGEGKSVDFGSVLSAVEAVEMAAAGDEEEKYAFHSFGAQFCELKVNCWTGEVRLQRITSVMDIGTVVNLKAARSQIIGGIVFGIGMALLEESVLEEKTGRYANANFAE